MKKLILTLLTLVCALCFAFGLAACGGGGDPSTVTHEHSLIHRNAEKADCENDGNIEYWQCEECGKYFTDERAENGITEEEVVIKAKHFLSHTAENPANCEDDGNIEYWQCEECGIYFTDGRAENGITEEETVIPAGHKLTHFDEEDPTCTENGNIEYWQCGTCGKYFGDELAEDELTEDEVFKDANGHDLTEVSENPATCDDDGNIGYWYCGTCKKYFDDENGENELTEGETVIPAGHTYDEENWVTDADYHWHAAVCEHSDLYIDRERHDFDDNETCTVCGYTVVHGTEGLEFVLNDDNVTYSVHSIGEATEKDIIIPNSYCGLPVTAIADLAFNSTDITGVEIPESILTIGTNAFAYCASLTDIKFSEGLLSMGIYAFRGCGFERITLPDSVQSIGNYAFYDCANLTEVVLGNGLQTIGTSVFRNCKNLTTLSVPFVGADSNGTNPFIGYLFGATKNTENQSYVPSSLNTVIVTGNSDIGIAAFYRCANIKSIVLGDGVANVGESAFSNSGIISITFGSSVQSFDAGAFDFCNSLKSVYYNGSVADWCKIKFADEHSNPFFYGAGFYMDGELVTELVIPDSVTVLSDYAFTRCRSIVSVKTDCLQSIGQYCFNYCSKLVDFVFPDTLTSIGYHAFYDVGLTEVTIPENFTSLASNAFYSCEALETIYWNAINCTTVGSSLSPSFRSCTGLKNIIVGDKVKVITSYLFYGCSSVKEIVIGNSVEEIGTHSFDGCAGINSLTLPDSLITIGDYAFTKTGLREITLGGKVTTVGAQAFSDCSKLTKVIIGDSVTSIGDHLFYNCYMLDFVKFGKGITVLSSYTFYDCRSLKTVILSENMSRIDSNVFYNVSVPDIFYEGTEDEWNKVDVRISGGISSSKVYFYTDEEPVEDGNFWHYDIYGEVEIWA